MKVQNLENWKVLTAVPWVRSWTMQRTPDLLPHRPRWMLPLLAITLLKNRFVFLSLKKTTLLRILKPKENNFVECNFCPVDILFSDSLLLFLLTVLLYVFFVDFWIRVNIHCGQHHARHCTSVVSFIYLFRTVVGRQVPFQVLQKRTWKHQIHVPRGLKSGQSYAGAYAINYC